MPNVTVQSLLDVLGKSGLPMGDSASMDQAGIGSRDVISSQVYGGDTQLPDLKNKYMSQISQIAAMDQKLGGVYGDPSSPLFLEKATARDAAIGGAHNTGLNVAKGVGSMYTNRKKDLESTINDANSLYGKLAALQKKEEDRIKQLVKDEEAIKSGKKKYVESNGIKVLVPVAKGKKSNASKIQDSMAKAAELRQQQKELTGIPDATAFSLFDKQPLAFKELWFDTVSSNDIPEGGFTMDQVKDKVAEWQSTTDVKSTNKKKLLEKYGLDK